MSESVKLKIAKVTLVLLFFFIFIGNIAISDGPHFKPIFICYVLGNILILPLKKENKINLKCIESKIENNNLFIVLPLFLFAMNDEILKTFSNKNLILASASFIVGALVATYHMKKWGVKTKE